MMSSSSFFFASTFGTATFSIWTADFLVWEADFEIPEGLACAGASSAGAAGGGVGEAERTGEGETDLAGAADVEGTDMVGDRVWEEDDTAGAALRARMGLLLGAGAIVMGAGTTLGMVGLVFCLRGETFLFVKVKTKQNKTKQNKTKQNKTKQNKTKQNKTNQIKSNQIKSNQIKSNQIKSNQIKPNQIKSKILFAFDRLL